MISSLQGIEHFFDPWKQAYSDSTVLSTGVVAVHLLAMFFGGGLAVAADRATLRLSGDSGSRNRHIEEIAATHRPVLIGLSVLFITGLAMLTSDLETFIKSPFLWIKLGFVVLLVLNGVVLQRTESVLGKSLTDGVDTDRLWKRLRVTSVSSLVLWGATLLAGITLANAV